jgi:hypothetical protein
MTIKTKPSAMALVSVSPIAAQLAAASDLIALARAERDSDAAAKLSRNALISALIEKGLTYENTAAYTAKGVKEGKVSAQNIVNRDILTMIALAAITANIGGEVVRLSDENIAIAMDKDVSNNKFLQGMPKGTINGETTWLGNASSYVGGLRNSIAEAMGEAPKTKKGAAKRKDMTRMGKLKEALQVAINLLEVEEEELDDISFEVAPRLAAYLRDGANRFGVELKGKIKA